MNCALNAGVIWSSSGSAMSSATKSSSQRVPMIERSGVVPPEISVRSFCSSTSQFTTSIFTSMSGCCVWKSLAIFWKYGPVAAL